MSLSVGIWRSLSLSRSQLALFTHLLFLSTRFSLSFCLLSERHASSSHLFESFTHLFLSLATLLSHCTSSPTHTYKLHTDKLLSSPSASQAPRTRGPHSLLGYHRGQCLQGGDGRLGPVVHLSEDLVHPNLQLKHSGRTV